MYEGSSTRESASASGSVSGVAPSTARTASAVVSGPLAVQSTSSDVRSPSCASRRVACASPSARTSGQRVSITSAAESGPWPTLSKKSGSSARTWSTIAVTTAAASVGVSPVRIIRCRRWSTMPDTVCTIEVKAATGMT